MRDPGHEVGTLREHSGLRKLKFVRDWRAGAATSAMLRRLGVGVLR